MKRHRIVPKRGSKMQKIILAMVAASLFTQSAIAECNCMGGTIVFTEDPLIFVEEEVNFHVEIDDVDPRDGECLIFITYPDGLTASYPEATGHDVRKLTVAPKLREKSAFSGLPPEVTLAQASSAAAELCWPMS